MTALPPRPAWRQGRRRGRHVYRVDLPDDHPDADVATFLHPADAARAVADRALVDRIRAVLDLGHIDVTDLREDLRAEMRE